MKPWEKAAQQPEAPSSGKPWEKARQELNAPGGEGPDKYRQAALDEERMKKEKGIEDSSSGYVRRGIQGATLNTADEILAAASTPAEMIKRGTLDPREAFAYAKAREDLRLERMREGQGVVGDVVEGVGGVASGIGVGAGIARAAPAAVSTFTRRAAVGAAEGGVTGAISGAADGTDAQSRKEKGLLGGAVGFAAGGAIPLAIDAVKGVGGRRLAALVAPQRAAENQLARSVLESGRAPDDVVRGLERAAQDGQGAHWTVADELGNPGQRSLSSVARSPGRGRTRAVEFLEGRQDGQSRRVASNVAEGLEAPRTRLQETALRKAQRSDMADEAYTAARGDAGAVNPTAAIQAADSFLQPGASGVLRPGNNIADDSVEGAVRKARSYLTDDTNVLTDFSAAHRAKVEIQNMIDKGSPSVQQALVPIRRALDRALEEASPTYASARNQFRAHSQGIEAVDEGYAAAQRGRSEDTIERFRSMGPQSRSGFRTGYADRVIENAQSGGRGANAARPMTASGVQDELMEFSPPNRRDLLQRRLQRENTMFETRGQAVGGSKTADNLADARATDLNPGVIVDVLQGNIGGLTRRGLQAIGNHAVGMPQNVRSRLAELLLTRADEHPDLARQMVETANRLRLNQSVEQGLYQGAASGSGQESHKRLR